jgi:ADP-ribosylglycohydrolase
MKNPTADRRKGIMFGLAYGDALGRPTEFMKASAIAKFGTPFRKQVGLNRPQQGIVTDDTQMSIAVAKAALGKPTPENLTYQFVMEFIAWQRDPKSTDGKRAPGSTCMGAVSSLQRNPAQWQLASRPNSKGNGANMRVAPLALRTDWTWAQLAGAAQLQAAITHGHPTALAAAELTAVAVRMLLEGFAQPGETLLDHLLAYAYDQRDTYHGEWLGHIWEAVPPQPVFKPKPLAARRMNWWEDAAGLTLAELPPLPMPSRAAARSPKEYINRGWDEVIDALLGIYDRPRKQEQDPCDVAGGGWIAEEALAASLHTLLCFPDDPTNALRRAAFTDGDSDSIASITGALAGAAYGLKAFPSHWIGNLEYRNELDGLTAKLTAATHR